MFAPIPDLTHFRVVLTSAAPDTRWGLWRFYAIHKYHSLLMRFVRTMMIVMRVRVSIFKQPQKCLTEKSLQQWWILYVFLCMGKYNTEHNPAKEASKSFIIRNVVRSGLTFANERQDIVAVKCVCFYYFLAVAEICIKTMKWDFMQRSIFLTTRLNFRRKELSGK